ncbi:hypothetical protein N2W54_004724 [Lotmaria passim]
MRRSSSSPSSHRNEALLQKQWPSNNGSGAHHTKESPKTVGAPAFVPCVEDAAYTRRIGHHPVAFQRTLDIVNYHYLLAQSHLAKEPLDKSAYVKTLSTSYSLLWEQRAQVPKGARREWLETVLVHLYALNKLEMSLSWLVDLDSHSDALNSPSTTGAVDDAAPATPSSSSSAGPARKQPKGKRVLCDAPPLWYLWQDTQRHLHHLTLRLHAWTPACGGAYAVREALRPSDLVRMDSSAFTWRVRQWVQLSCVVLTTPTASMREVQHADLAASVLLSGEQQLEIALAGPSSAFREEEPELCRVLASLTSSASAAVKEKERQQTAGAILYRMLVEVTLVRLRALPRCVYTWRLLRGVLDRCATSIAPFSAALGAMCAYVDAVIIPYLEQRDCRLGNLRHAAADIHAHFAQLSREHTRALCTAVSKDAAMASSEHVGRAAEQENSSCSFGVLDGGGRLAEPPRVGMSAALGNTLRRVCVSADSGPTPTLVTTGILSDENDDDDEDEDDEEEEDAMSRTLHRDTPAETEVLGSAQKEMTLKEVDDRLFYSRRHRTAQMQTFLHCYFTQSPTLAFDCPSRSVAVDVLSMVREE